MDICGETAVPVEERAAAVQNAIVGLNGNGAEERVTLEKKYE